ncbi:hypothetical protein BJF78_13890 [Pseudonocardia sp. CNS-139]|nr:hypothetical protein BJF78_13890 [Pseudonocardia sp. CNS-139]
MMDEDEADNVVVLRGAPDDAELAALLAVLAALRAAQQPPAEDWLPPPAPLWTRPPRYRPAGAWTGR